MLGAGAHRKLWAEAAMAFIVVHNLTNVRDRAESPESVWNRGLHPTAATSAGDPTLLMKPTLKHLRVAFCDPGSTNLGAADAYGLPAPSDFVYAHTPREIRWWFDDLTALELGPMFSIFEPGFLRVALAYERAGRMLR